MDSDYSIPNFDNDIELFVRVARMYYEQQLTQTEIGHQLGTSRSTVSRLLQEARDKGVVQITIDYPSERDARLEDQLKAVFDLDAVRVLSSLGRNIDAILEGMGGLAAEYLNQIVDDDMILGVSYGRSVASAIKKLKPTRKVNMTVVQIIGALGVGSPLVEGPDLAREMANAYGAEYRYLHAPLIVEDRRARDLLIQEPSIQRILSIGAQANVVLMGIGSLASSASGLIYSGYLTKREQNWLSNIGAIGHMCAQFFDAQGEVLDIELNNRVISIGLETLRDIKQVIAVAGSKDKALAILGALRGGYINTLITDDLAAREIVRLMEEDETITA
jgi:deoxyribonucleoside regulator